jgi:hypothetical protein
MVNFLRVSTSACWSEGAELTSSTAQQNLPQATLALSEYSEMAIFSSTRWSAKLSGLHKRERRVSTRARSNRAKLRARLPVSHGADEDDDGMSIRDGGQVLGQLDRGGVE